MRCLSEPWHTLRVSWVGERISNLVRKPDAANPHFRFDERDLETEDRVSYSGTGIPKGLAHRLRLNLTPPRQISTLPFSGDVSEQFREVLEQDVRRFLFLYCGIGQPKT
jgi:hypothetical protein